MTFDALAWQVDEVCLNARPSPRQLLLDGWLLRAAGGASRQTNSVNPLRNGPHDPSAVLERAEIIYAALGRPCLFRSLTMAPGMDAPLQAAGYSREGETCALLAPLQDWALPADPAVAVTAPDAAWRATRSRLNAADAAADALYSALLGAIVEPKAFAALSADGVVVSLAYAVLCGELVVMESVVTDPAYRGRGLAKRVVAGLMLWGQAAGAKAACLQVVADNAPARAAYAALGFGQELYRYNYWRQAGPS